MKMRLSLVLLACAAAAGAPADAGECDAPARAAEAAFGIPAGLLSAIGRIESGRATAVGTVEPWPWSVNAEGRSYLLGSRAEAVALVASLQRQGVRLIDVGCFQINLFHHPDAFASLDQAFDPAENATAAGRFLRTLRDAAGAWESAVAFYHSANPALGLPYMAQVWRSWTGGGAAPAAGFAAALAPIRVVASVRVFVPGGAMPAAPRIAGRLPVVFTPSR